MHQERKKQFAIHSANERKKPKLAFFPPSLHIFANEHIINSAPTSSFQSSSVKIWAGTMHVQFHICKLVCMQSQGPWKMQNENQCMRASSLQTFTLMRGWQEGREICQQLGPANRITLSSPHSHIHLSVMWTKLFVVQKSKDASKLRIIFLCSASPASLISSIWCSRIHWVGL